MGWKPGLPVASLLLKEKKKIGEEIDADIVQEERAKSVSHGRRGCKQKQRLKAAKAARMPNAAQKRSDNKS